MDSSVVFSEFLKWYEDRQNSGSTVFVAHTSKSFASITRFNSLDSWVIDSGVANYITGNKTCFSSICTSSYLPSITMTNGFRVSSLGVGTIHLIP